MSSMKNPVLSKELRATARRPRLVLGLFVFNTVLAFMVVAVFRLNFYISASEVSYSNVIRFFSWIEIAEFLLLAFIVPSLMAGSIAGEREKQTLDILLTTPMSTLTIIVGKLLASTGTILLFIFSSLPIMSVVFLIGGVGLFDIVLIVVYACVFAIYIGSIGIFFSSIFRRTIFATITTYGACVFTCVLPYVAYWIGYWIYLSGDDGLSDGFQVPGWLLLLGLFSPVDSLVSMLSYQIAGNTWYRQICLLNINVDSFWQSVNTGEWMCASMLLQMLVAAVLILLSAKILEPVKAEKKHWKIEEKNV